MKEADAIEVAAKWLRECHDWMLAKDLDGECPMQADPLDIAEALEALTPRADRTEREAIEQAVMVCPQCEGEGGYPDGLDEDACHTDCTRCGSNGWIVDLASLTPRANGREITRTDILREWFGGERYARDYEYLDASFGHRADAILALRPTPPVEGEKLGYRSMGSGGRCDWTQLREAVSESTCGYRDNARPFDPKFYPGHQMVEGINYNSLDRIVTAFVDSALSTPVEVGAIDRARVALTAIRELEPETLWGFPERYTEQRTAHETLNAEEVFKIVDEALAALSTPAASGDEL